MTNPQEAKKEAVRITLPPRVPPASTAAASSSRDTVRINLPSRPPANRLANQSTPQPQRPATVPLPPVSPTSAAPSSPPPPMSQPSAASAPAKPFSAPTFLPPSIPPQSTPRRPAVQLPFSTPKVAAQGSVVRATQPLVEPPSPGPKKETAHISVLSDLPKPSGSVQMKKTQPLISMPETKAPVTPVHLAPAGMKTMVDSIPKSLCWALVAVSAATLIIQIWNYLS